MRTNLLAASLDLQSDQTAPVSSSVLSLSYALFVQVTSPTPLFHAPPPTRVYAFVFTEPPLAPQLSASCCLSLPTTISSSSYISLTCANFSRIKRGEARSKEDRTTPPPLPKVSKAQSQLNLK